MAQAAFHVLGTEFDLLENLRVRLETDEGAIRLIAGLAFLLGLELALFEKGFDEFTLAMTANEELPRECVHRFGAHAIQPDAELEDIIVVFGAGVDFRDAIHDLAQGDAASEIADRARLIFDGDLHLFAVAHDEFVDAVVDDLFEEDTTAAVVM